MPAGAGAGADAAGGVCAAASRGKSTPSRPITVVSRPRNPVLATRPFIVTDLSKTRVQIITRERVNAPRSSKLGATQIFWPLLVFHDWYFSHEPYRAIGDFDINV